MTYRALIPVLLGFLVGCSSSSGGSNGATGDRDGGAPGSERNACYPNGTCNSGLTCLSNLCVRAPAGSGGQAGASGGTAGSGGTSSITGGATSTGGAEQDAATADAAPDASEAGASTGGTGGSANGGLPDASIDHAIASDSGNAEAGSHASRCQPGHYAGTFSCTLAFGDAGPSLSLNGVVNLNLVQDQGGDVLTVSSGSLTSVAGVMAMSATLVGQLSCRSGAFEGTLQNGALSIPPFPPSGTVSGGLSGGFVESGPKLDGTWTLVGAGTLAGYHCTGPWTATWQPG